MSTHVLDTSAAPADGPTPRRGIVVLIGATMAMALGFGSLALTSIFMRPLEAEFGWTRADISLGYAVASTGMAVGGLAWGWISDRVDIRVLLAIGGSGMFLSVASMAIIQSLWQLYLANAILAGLGFSVLYAPLLAAPGDWFDSRRGLAVGIVTAGGALGQGLLPFLANHLIDALGWRAAYACIALIMLACLGMSLPLVTRPGSGRTSLLQASSHEIAEARGGERLRVSLLSLAAFLCCACMGMPLVHLASFVTMICGSPSIGATSLLVAMLFGTVGRISFGLLADRIGYLPSYAGASLIQTIAVGTYPLLDNSLSILALSAVFGFGFAGNMTCLVLCIREAVPAQRFGSTLGLVMLIAWLGMGAGGYTGGALFDATGSYVAALLLASAAGILNLVVIAIMTIMKVAAKRKTRALVPSPVAV